MKRSTLTGGQQFLLVLPGQTVNPGLEILQHCRSEIEARILIKTLLSNIFVSNLRSGGLCPELHILTLGDLMAEPQELLRHPDILQVG